MPTLRSPRVLLTAVAAVGLGVFLSVASHALHWSESTLVVVGVALVASAVTFGVPLLVLPLNYAHGFSAVTDDLGVLQLLGEPNTAERVDFVDLAEVRRAVFGDVVINVADSLFAGARNEYSDSFARYHLAANDILRGIQAVGDPSLNVAQRLGFESARRESGTGDETATAERNADLSRYVADQEAWYGDFRMFVDDHVRREVFDFNVSRRPRSPGAVVLETRERETA